MQLFRDAQFPDVSGSAPPKPGPFTYTPPPDCPPPWAKVVLSMDLAGTIDSAVKGVAVELKGVTVFLGPTPDTAQPYAWHVERDLTDYSALLKTPGTGGRSGLIAARIYPEGGQVTGTALLRFYPATAAQPAPRVPDAVYSVGTQFLPAPANNSDDAVKELDSLPHNIERAYLDVTSNDDAFWYTCFQEKTLEDHPTLANVLGIGLVTRSIFPHEQGCSGSSYSEAGVTVDGSPAGVAPVFPWLPTDFSARPVFWNAVDAPTDSAMSLGFIPYRIDLTPFAAILNEAGSHWIALVQRAHPDHDGTWYLAPRTANLLVYLDHGKTRVSGAVTFNSLAPGLANPTVTDTLAQDGSLLEGRIRTRMDRSFEIRGYVDTSHGRIHSRVTQQSSFHNVQALRVEGDGYSTPSEYHHDLWLDSTLQSVSRRARDGQVLSEDHINVSYPLELHYIGVARMFQSDGPYSDLAGGRIAVDQRRWMDVSHSRQGVQPYTTRLRERFYGSHNVNPDTGASSDWHAAHAYLFRDDRGSCYQKVVTTRGGELESSTTGTECPNGINHVRWFAHPDGSADGLSWLHP